MVNMFKEIFEDENIEKVGQNMKYDIIVLSNYGVQMKGKMFDTMIAHYVLQPELYHSMDYMAETYLNYETIKIESLIGERGKGQRNMRDLTAGQIYEYACEDADVTLKLKNILAEELKKEGCEKLFYEIEMPPRSRRPLPCSPAVCTKLKGRYLNLQVNISIFHHPSRWATYSSAN